MSRHEQAKTLLIHVRSYTQNTDSIFQKELTVEGISQVESVGLEEAGGETAVLETERLQRGQTGDQLTQRLTARVAQAVEGQVELLQTLTDTQQQSVTSHSGN